MSCQKNTTSIAVQEIKNKAIENLQVASILINRNYLSDLSSYDIDTVPSEMELSLAADVRFFKIERIVQNNKQSALESATAAYTALGAAGYTVFLFIDCNGVSTDLYIGARGEPGDMLGQNAGELLQETFKGHFSGSLLNQLDYKKIRDLISAEQGVKSSPAASITSVTAVPALSTESREHFMQGLERFIDAAENRVYQALILAESMSSVNLDIVRAGYEQIYSQLSPLVKQQLSYGEQENENINLSISENLSSSFGESLGLTETRGTSKSQTISQSETHGISKSVSYTRSATAGVNYFFVNASQSSSLGVTKTESYSSTKGVSDTYGENESTASSNVKSQTQTVGKTDTQTVGQSFGVNKQISIESIDKTVEQLLARIEHNLERIGEAKTYGGWHSAAYFIGENQASSEALASIFLGLIRGSNSAHENFALTTWKSDNKNRILNWLCQLRHPELKPGFSTNTSVGAVTPATLMSSKEMAIQLSLPRRSTSTVSVVETQAFGRQVQRLDERSPYQEPTKQLKLGNIRHLWENLEQPIELNMDQLTGHVFVSGSTGSGKSNTLYSMLDQISAAGIPFLVIEPAKGEYKNVFGQRDDVTVLGTNPSCSKLLRINPFRFPEGIHVLEHIDRLIEIFNICWPMYAAMPAVLKSATLKAYRDCGWDLDSSVNSSGSEVFPSFVDLLQALEQVVEGSAYSDEVKGNYIGSLATRVESLTNGLNGQIFTDDEVGDELLFNSCVLVDLSRVGSSETKALIMGLLVMRLSEYRMTQGGMNQKLRHVTVLEEAHNILRRNPEVGMEGAGVAAKAVEMLTNAIAEMRTYGEGFIVVDQSPGAVDIAAIRNTNTKIILRLPEEADRRLIGKSIALREEQLDEIARLPKGVGIVYQNDWLEPVMCKIGKFSGEEVLYKYIPEKIINRKEFNREALKLILSQRVGCDVNIEMIEEGLSKFRLEEKVENILRAELAEYAQNAKDTVVESEVFSVLADKVVSLLGYRSVLDDVHEYAAFPRVLVDKMDDLIRGFSGDTPMTVCLSAQQCLLYESVRHNPRNHEAYAAWRVEVEKRVV